MMEPTTTVTKKLSCKALKILRAIHNVGIDYIYKDEYDKAIATLHATIHLLSAHAETEQEGQVLSSILVHCEPIHKETKVEDVDSSSSTTTTKTTPTDLIVANGHGYHRHHRMEFICSDPTRIVDLPTNAFQIAALSLSNLALAHLCKALKGGNSKTDDGDVDDDSFVCSRNVLERLKRALCMYQESYKIRLQYNIHIDIFQAMALVNNCGHIHYILCVPTKANRLFHHLLCLIVFFIHTDNNNNTTQTTNFNSQNNDLNAMIHSVSHLILSDPFLAPAA